MSVSPIPTTRIYKDYPKEQIIRDINLATKTRRMIKMSDEHVMVSYINKQRRTNHKDYQNCLFACFLSQIEPKKVIQALTDPSWIEAMQEELLQFKLQKVWTLVDLPKGKRAIRTKIEVIKLFLAYVSFIGFIVYQMDVKSAFLYEKALYGLHQAPRAWYETLSTYLLENGFRRGIIDKTLFIKNSKGDILLVQVYVDDIIFGSTKKSLCIEFEGLMHKKFQISSMRELTFFLGLQVKQKDDGIFISQDKYVADILKKFDFVTMKTTSTPIETHKALLKDEEAEDVDVHLYKLMIGSLMYLTASRPDIMFAVCACARDSPFDLEAFSDSDYAGASLDRKSTTGGCQFLGKRLISWQCKKQTIVANSTTKATEENAEFHRIVDFLTTSSIHYALNFVGKTVVISESSMRSDLHFNDEDGITCLENTTIFKNLALMGQALQKDTQLPQTSVPIPNVADEAVFKERDDRVVRATTTAASLDATQASGNITKTQSMAISNDPISQEIGLGDRLRVLALEQSKTAQDLVINKLQKKVKRLEKAPRARTLGMKLFKIDSDFDVLDDAMENIEGGSTAEQITTAGDTLNTASINVSTARLSNGSAVGPSTSTTGDIFKDEMTTIADTLVAIRSARPRTTSVVIRNVEEEPRRATLVPTVQSQDKRKGKMVEPKPTLKNPRKAQIQMDEELAQRVAEQEAKDAALIEQIDVFYCKALDAESVLSPSVTARLQEQEREQFSVNEHARFLVESIAARKKFFVAQKAAEIRNRPPTITQLRNQMITYLKHMGKYTHNQLKSKNFEEIQNSKKAESSKKRPRAKHDEESVKKQKLQDDAEKEELRACLDIVQGDDIAIDVESLATKYPIGDLKTLFEPCEEDEVRRNQQGYNLINWRLFDSCGVHVLLMDNEIAIHMMIEKKYPLTQEMLSMMINRRLEVDHESEMTFELLRFTRSQLKK
ncbi:retrovirus-related pol polyprotein from transposon TNT 1-94 [Tanacetum coccineum]